MSAAPVTTRVGYHMEGHDIFRGEYDRETNAAVGQPWKVARIEGTKLVFVSAEAAKKRLAIMKFLTNQSPPITWNESEVDRTDPTTRIAEAIPEDESATVDATPEPPRPAPMEIQHDTSPNPADPMPDIYNRQAMVAWVTRSMPHALPFPEINQSEGDKTPDLVIWLQKFHPEEFKRRYGVIGQGTVEAKRIGPSGKTETFRRPCLMALRKTVLTEKQPR